jgi:phosphatidate cytidylyltransferase
MLQRILTALVGIPLIILTLFTWHGNLFVVAMGILSILGAHEFFRAVKQQQKGNPNEILGIILCATIAVAGYLSTMDFTTDSLMISLFIILTATPLLGLITEIFRPNRAPVANIGALFLGVFYIGWLFFFIPLIRRSLMNDMSVSGIPGKYDQGAFLVLYIFSMIWATDTFAFFFGKLLGKRKLCPSLSPGKTVVGALGGLFGGIIIGLLVGHWFKISIYHAMSMGIIAGIFSQIGDLVESAIKRDLGIKDFGALLPGHGGVLDRFNSALIVFPALFIYICFFEIWP